MSEILTIKEAAELLKVHEITLYRLLRDGKLSGTKVGRQWRFDKKRLLSKYV